MSVLDEDEGHAEIRAMAEAYACLSQLDHAAQDRALDWLCDRIKAEQRAAAEGAEEPALREVAG